MEKELTITDNLQPLMKERYYQPNESTPQGMIKRVADYVAFGEVSYGWSNEEINQLANEYYEIFNNRLALPSSPFLMNAGTEIPMLFACFVVGGLEDNIKSIYKTLERQGTINKMGGGTGFNFSILREEGSPIVTTGGTSSGVMSFMELFNTNAEAIKQGGRRRSANMGILNYNHPEILKFIGYKMDLNRLNNFNISVLVDDEFMNKVKNKEDYELISPLDGIVVGTLNAYDVFMKIMENSWKSGEPALLFRDNINSNNPMRKFLGDIDCTNPCGETPLYPFEACDLASINLEEFVDWNGNVDWSMLRYVVRMMVRFLDTAIDVNMYPEQIIEKSVKDLRRLGLGITGLHGALIKKGFRYSSQEGRNFATELQCFIQQEAWEMSIELANIKGVFPLWHESDFKELNLKVRNVAITIVPPVGTTSMILNTSTSGCEPMFAIAYQRIIDDEVKFVCCPIFEEHAKLNGYWTDDLVEKVVENKGRAKDIDQIPEKYQELFETAMEISPKNHVLMQGELQVYVDNSISKTINLPKEATIQDVADAYMLGWELGLKGMTVYRNGSRESQVLSVGTVETYEHGEQEWNRGFIKIAPKVSADSKTVRLDTGCGTMYLNMTKDEDGYIDQTFINKGSKGTCLSNQTAVSRLISLALRGGIDVEHIIDQLRSVPVCPNYYGRKKAGEELSKGSSCPSAVSYELEDYSKEYSWGIDINPKEFKIEYDALWGKGEECPECGTALIYEGGCVQCKQCGYSKCD